MELGAKVRQAFPVRSVFDHQGLKTTAPHQPIALATTLSWHFSSSLQTLMALKTVRESSRGRQLFQALAFEARIIAVQDGAPLEGNFRRPEDEPRHRLTPNE
jgi:hypothetical protein